jgi:hypothetical protein
MHSRLRRTLLLMLSFATCVLLTPGSLTAATVSVNGYWFDPPVRPTPAGRSDPSTASIATDRHLGILSGPVRRADRRELEGGGHLRGRRAHRVLA